MIHHDRASHPLFWLIAGMCTLMIEHFVFSIITVAGLIDCRDTFHAVLHL